MTLLRAFLYHYEVVELLKENLYLYVQDTCNRNCSKKGVYEADETKEPNTLINKPVYNTRRKGKFFNHYSTKMTWTL